MEAGKRVSPKLDWASSRGSSQEAESPMPLTCPLIHGHTQSHTHVYTCIHVCRHIGMPTCTCTQHIHAYSYKHTFCTPFHGSNLTWCFLGHLLCPGRAPGAPPSNSQNVRLVRGQMQPAQSLTGCAQACLHSGGTLGGAGQQMCSFLWGSAQPLHIAAISFLVM